VQVAFAGLTLAGEHVALQTVPTAVLVQAEGQVARVREGGAIVHTAGKERSSNSSSSTSTQLLPVSTCCWFCSNVNDTGWLLVPNG
jgi:hypothetical protein